MLISALMLFMLFVMILLFSVLTFILYAVALSMSLLVRSWSSPLQPPIRSMSLANRRLHMAFLQWRSMCGGHGVFPAWSSLGTSLTEWVKISIPEEHLLLSWRTPPLAIQEDCTAGVLIKCLDSLNQSFLYIKASKDLPQAWLCQTPSKSIKLWNRSCWCFSMMTQLLKICSTVL